MPDVIVLSDRLLGRSSTELSYKSRESVESLCMACEAATFSRPNEWIGFMFPIGTAKMTSYATVVTLADWKSDYVPRTPLGRKLLALRAKAISAGMELLSEEEVLEEVRQRRGGVEAGEADIH